MSPSSGKYKKIYEPKGLQVNEIVQDFEAKDIHRQKYSLSSALKNGPVVLIFIWGQWCPVCNKHLKHLQENFHGIYEKGASVVVVSPEKSEFLKKTIDKTGIEFTLLYDEGQTIADAFDVTFLPGKITRFFVNTFMGAKLSQSHSDDSEQLAIPATYIIGQDFKITWRHFDPNHKNRASADDIIKNLP